MVDVEKGVRRVTFALPFGIDHVHCYFLRSSSGGWILVDTGLGSRDPEARWRPVLDELDAPVERIVVTHMHPDHVGGARDVAALTGAPVLQGREDYAQCVRAWGRRDPRAVRRLLDRARDAGEPTCRGSRRSRRGSSAAVHWVRDPQLLEAGDEVDGWRVEVLRGHADGHIVLLRDGVLIAGDTILARDHARDRPLPGLAPRPARRLPRDARPDRGARAADRLRRAPDPVDGSRPGARARSGAPRGAARPRRRRRSNGRPLTAYEVSLALFGAELSPTLRRFATAESLAHLERLVLEGRAERAGSRLRRCLR